MRKEKVLKSRKKTEEEFEFNGLRRKRKSGRINIFKKTRIRLFQNTGGTREIPDRPFARISQILP
jgi:hypothetical protein